MIAGFALGGFVWGLAEATVFFIVPDVLLTGAAIIGRRAAWMSALFALVGALAGGSMMYLMARGDPVAAHRLVARLPGSSTGVLAGASEELRARGGPGMIIGSVTFVPYKCYAVAAPGVGIGLGRFLAMSAAARGLRFVLTTLLARWLSTRVLASWSLRRKIALHAGVWLVIYAVYFGVVVQ